MRQYTSHAQNRRKPRRSSDSNALLPPRRNPLYHSLALIATCAATFLASSSLCESTPESRKRANEIVFSAPRGPTRVVAALAHLYSQAFFGTDQSASLNEANKPDLVRELLSKFEALNEGEDAKRVAPFQYSPLADFLSRLQRYIAANSIETHPKFTLDQALQASRIALPGEILPSPNFHSLENLHESRINTMALILSDEENPLAVELKPMVRDPKFQTWAKSAIQAIGAKVGALHRDLFLLHQTLDPHLNIEVRDASSHMPVPMDPDVLASLVPEASRSGSLQPLYLS